MKIALIADIHGNLPALEVVLEDLEGEKSDQLICLGDVSAMGPFPVESLERVQGLNCPVIMGNGDAEMLDPPVGPEGDETARRFGDMDRWCAEQLSEEHKQFIRSFSSSKDMELPGNRSLLSVHGSPRSYNEIISATTPDDELVDMLTGTGASIVACGHWHFQMLRRHKHQTLLNPGSVGLPYESDPEGNIFIPSRTEYGLITVTDVQLRFEHRRVDYDSTPVIRAMHARGFPHADWWESNWG